MSVRVASLHLGGDRAGLYEPIFNFREIAKQLILLEDHLAHPYKTCLDCVRKHLMTIEALAEEATTLDTQGILQGSLGSISETLAELARKWLENVQDGRPLQDIGHDVRRLRKDLTPMVCDPREKSLIERVASRHLQRRILCPHK